MSPRVDGRLAIDAGGAAGDPVGVRVGRGRGGPDRTGRLSARGSVEDAAAAS